MADIAMLVAEEYERRINKSRKIGAEKNEEIVSPRVDKSYYKNFGEQEVEIPLALLKWLMAMEEPKTQIALAAINGFFSA
ncbi:Ubiquitin-activating enzyme like [Actinidia chinensis var. chinensis]|uniref:Uncharacterized protein n=2 Tax=Actinidia TaxID=3624 RepID=A0A7J0DNT0_9ERIC|nr:Ubiquitin-activating enzyme like [Actinidia chinensis var. chinensis]GFS38276.1 hypothetical protein Acr_00g0056620 [Actinidia rufa]